MMIRSNFDEQLASLNNMLIEMGALIETAISMATQALKNQDVELAKKTILFDHEVNQMEKDIETMCFRLMLHQQPVAKDFRLVSAVLKMITDMERIGDQAADISELTMLLAGKPFIKKLEHIPMMAEATVKMVNDSIDAFVKQDLDLARSVIAYDDVVDELFNTVKNDLIKMISLDSSNGEQAIDLIMVAKYFERIGDHSVNIAEWVVYAMTGVHISEELTSKENK